MRLRLVALAVALPAVLGVAVFAPLVAQAAAAPTFVTDPSAVVLGRTLTEWARNYINWGERAPYGPAPAYYTAFNDPTGEFAEANNRGPMFYITANTNTTGTRTTNVPADVAIFFPIGVLEDSEGPIGNTPPLIPPTIPGFKGSYAQEVATVMADSTYTNLSMQVDGQNLTGLQVARDVLFNAGVVTQNSTSRIWFTGQGTPLPIGLQLIPSGVEGAFVIIKNLSPGPHTVTTHYTFVSTVPAYPCATGCPASDSEIINVVAR